MVLPIHYYQIIYELAQVYQDKAAVLDTPTEENEAAVRCGMLESRRHLCEVFLFLAGSELTALKSWAGRRKSK